MTGGAAWSLPGYTKVESLTLWQKLLTRSRRAATTVVNRDGEDMGPCQIWLGATDNDGYPEIRCRKGTLGVKTGVVRVHRLAFYLRRGSFPLKAQVDHLCRKRRCINPDHLELIGRVTHGKLSREDQLKDAE